MPPVRPLLALLVASLLGAAAAQTPLDDADTAAGYYTVGGTSPDFADPDAALAALAARGMKGPVTFRIRAGTYTVRESLPHDLRTGAAAADPEAAPLLIRAANPNARPTLVSGADAAANWTLRLRGLDHVTLRNLDFDASGAGDYGRILVLKEGADGGGADDVSVQGCTFTGAASGADTADRALVWSDQGNHDRLAVAGSTFTDGWAGVYISDGAGAARNPDASFTDNTFEGQATYGLFGDEMDGVVVDGNVFTGAGDIAVLLGYGVGYTVTANTIHYTSVVGQGLYLNGAAADASGTALVANNAIRTFRPVILTNSPGVRLVHNTLVATSTFPVLSALGASAEIAELTSNILYGVGGGEALTIGDLTDLVASDGNVLYTAGASLVDVGGTDYADLEAWQDLSGLDARSRSVVVQLVDPAGGDLHLGPVSDGDPRLAGVVVPDVATDIDGEPRSADNPYIGADEGAVALVPLAGYYTAGVAPPGFATPDYPSLQAALNDVHYLGVSGTVTLGFHTDPGGLPVTVLPFDGGSEAARLQIVPQEAASTLVHTPTDDDSNGAIRIADADFVTLSDFGVDVSGATGLYSQAIQVSGEVEGLRLERLVLAGPAVAGPPAGVRSSQALVSVYATTTDLLVEDCTTTGGDAGLFVSALTAADWSTGMRILDSRFDDAPNGLFLTGAEAAVIEDVEVTSSVDGAVGMYVSGEGHQVTRARVHVPVSTDYTPIGATFYQPPSGVSTPRGLGPAVVTNSFVSSGGIGVVVQAGVGVELRHTTVHAGSGNGLRVLSTESLLVENSVVVSESGYAVYGDGGSVAAFGVNDLHTAGPTFSVWNGSVYGDLAAFQAGTALCGDCVSVPVTFADAAAGDLHLAGASDGDPALAGVPLAEVTTDIDGDARSATDPYLGADEASAFTAGITLSVAAYLQGAYAGSGTMSTALADAGLVPLAQPYGDPAYDGTALDYDGTESVASVPADVVDWVLLGLRETPDGPDIARRALFITGDGTLREGASGTVIAFDGVAPGTYHVVVYHRNHVPIVSTAQALSGVFQFVSLRSTSKVYGGAGAYAEVMNGATTQAALWAADGSGDGLVTAPDFNVYGSASGDGAAGYVAGDYTLDGQVTAPDFNLYNANAAAGAASGVPD